MNETKTILGRYVLIGRVPVREDNLIEWATKFEQGKNIVKQEQIRGVKISTVFLGLDHNWSGGKPVLFETMIFEGKHDQYQTRCSTWEEAEEMHREAVDLVRYDIFKPVVRWVRTLLHNGSKV